MNFLFKVIGKIYDSPARDLLCKIKNPFVVRPVKEKVKEEEKEEDPRKHWNGEPVEEKPIEVTIPKDF